MDSRPDQEPITPSVDGDAARTAMEKRPLLLIVDDDERTAILLARLLGDEGYDAEVAVDGGAALARLALAPIPDALITDFHLPQANGLVVGRFARTRRAAIPIFIVTGYPQSLQGATEPEDAPIVVLTKPLNYADLVRRLAKALPTPREV
jgi:CheY-like chemotaxis protein